MFDEKNVKRAREKRDLLIRVMESYCENVVYDYIVDEEYNSMEELDQWLDKTLDDFHESINRIKNYYNEIIDS